MSYFKIVQYKSPSVPSARVESWYSSLEKPFPRTYIPTAPDSETGVSSIREFDRLYPHIDEELFVFADGFLSKHFSQIKTGKVMSHEEILVHMNKTTSPGFPFAKSKKRDYLYDPQFKRHVDDLEIEMIDDHVPFVWKWAQKYELRTVEKAAQRKIRGFCVAPVDHAYLQSKYFTDFNENFFDLSDDDSFPSAVGMSKYYLGFDNLARYITRHPHIFSTDFSGFDSTISPQLMEWIFHFKLKWCKFTPAQLEVVWGLVMSNVYSVIILENGDVVIKQGGNPSGQSNTIVDNTMIQIILFMMGYRHAMRGQPDKLTFGYFMRNVCFKCFGDDCIFSVSDDVLPYFNFKIWRDFLKPYGFTLKGNEEPTDIFGAEFLSHHFIDYKGVYLPVPDTTKLLNSLLMGGSSDDPLYLLMRAHSIRIEVWPDVEARNYVEDYIRYFYSHYNDDLKGSYMLAPGQYVDLEMIKGFYFTDEEILALYMGYESGCGKLLNYLGHIKKHFLDLDTICSDIPSFYFSLFTNHFVPNFQSASMSTVRADKAFTLLEQTTGLSSNGKAWATACIDPFHDEAIPNLCGYPDGTASRSVVQIVRTQMTITKSVKVAAATWDLHLISFPSTNVTEFLKGTTWSRPAGGGAITIEPGDLPIYGTTNDPAAGPYARWGGVCGYQCEPNTNSANPFNGSNSRPDPDLISSTCPDSQYLTGNYRVIAKGYEVLSVGADLTKSGTLYAWQAPVANSPDLSSANFVRVSAAGAMAASATWSSLSYDFCPSTISEANLIPDTKSWPQKYGAYVVDRMDTTSNFTYNSQDAVVAYRDSTTPGDGFIAIPAVFNTCTNSQQLTVAGASAPTSIPVAQTSSISPFHHSGVYFTGLNASDVIVVNCIWYIERFPTDCQKDLLVLTQPSPLRDEVAMNIYSTLASKMPVAMYQNSNSFGDWFKDAVSLVSDTVAPALSMMPGPIGMVGKAVTAGGKMLDKVLERTKDSPAVNNNQENVLKATEKREERNVDRALRKNSARPQKKKAVKSLTRDLKKLGINGQKKKTKKRTR